MNNIKRFIKSFIPKAVRNRLSNIFYNRDSRIDLSVIEILREKDLDYLSNPNKLENELLLQLGLNNAELFNFPENLYPYCGKGLFSWQYPIQFSKYLTHLSKYKIESYLEIGVHHGGTFVITVEYLEKFNPMKNALGIDIRHCTSLMEYKKLNKKIDFKIFDSKSPGFKRYLRRANRFDLILIDGDHEEMACKNDFQTIKDIGNIIVFHDIVGEGVRGVGRVWEWIKDTYKNDFQFYEFADQYDTVYDKTGKKWLGIGMAVKNEYLKVITEITES